MHSSKSPVKRAPRLVSGAVAAASLCLVPAASAQLISDNFADGSMAPLWTRVEGDPSVTVIEANGRLEFRTTGTAAPEGKQFAGYAARNWHLRTTSDFRVRASFRSFPSGVTTTVGSKQAVCIALCGVEPQSIPGGLPSSADVFEIGARRQTASVTNRWLAHGRIGPFGAWDIAAWAAQPQTPFNFVHIEYPSYTFTIGYEVTLFVRYDSANDKIFISGASYTDPDAHWMSGFTNGSHDPRRVFVGGYAEKAGTVTGADSWVDNVQVDLGVIDSAPGNVSAGDGTFTDRVRVTWSAPPNATGYKVYRRTGSGADSLLATVGPSALQHDDLTAVASTLYTYTVKTLTSLGEGYGDSDTGFRAVPGPTGLAASDGTSTAGVNLSWNAVTGAVGYRVLRAEGSAAPAQVGIPTGTTFVDTTAVAGTVYAYSVKARFASTDSAAGTANNGWRSLPLPGSVAATDGTLTTGVAVTWGAVTGATGYSVLRSIGDGAAGEVGTPTATTFTDATATAGVTYSYRVAARSAAGTSVASAAETGWRNVAAPTGVNATDGTSAAHVSVAWTGVPGATGYKLFRAAGSAAAVQVGGTLPAAPTSATDATAVAGTLYTYTVRAVTAPGDSAASAGNAGWRNLPAPTGVSAGDGTSTSGVAVAWTPVTGATGYRVYRAQGAAAAAEIGTPTAAAFTDTAAVAGTTYTYSVKARSVPGDSAASAGDAGWRNIPAPTNVSATDGTSTANVGVTWTPAVGATGYKVFRAAGAEVPAQVGATLAAGTTGMTDASAVAGTPYTYTVKATTASGDSAASAGNAGWRNLTAPTGVNATDGTMTTGVTVTWSPVTGAVGYRVMRAIGSGAATEVGAPTDATFTDTTGAAGTIYTYTVKARTAAGDSAASAGNTGWRNAAAPAGVSASDGTFADKVLVAWTASPESTVTGYRILRRLATETTTVQVGIVTGRATVTFSDTTIAVGVVGFYAVQAQTAAGNSPASLSDSGFRANSSSLLAGPPPADGNPRASGGMDERPAVPVPGGTPHAAGNAGAGGESADAPMPPPASPAAAGESDAQTGRPAPPDEAELVARLEGLVLDARAAGTDEGRKLADRLAVLLPMDGDDDPSPCPAIRMLRGDVNLDGKVDGADLDAFLAAARERDGVAADLDRDGSVGPGDLEALVRALAAAPQGGQGRSVR